MNKQKLVKALAQVEHALRLTASLKEIMEARKTVRELRLSLTPDVDSERGNFGAGLKSLKGGRA